MDRGLRRLVSIIAAQSIGEPGTQLTMRTFHIGGTASRVSEQNTLDARHTGTVHYEGLVVVETHKEGGQLIVMNRNGQLVIKNEKGRDRERYPAGAPNARNMRVGVQGGLRRTPRGEGWPEG